MKENSQQRSSLPFYNPDARASYHRPSLIALSIFDGVTISLCRKQCQAVMP